MPENPGEAKTVLLPGQPSQTPERWGEGAELEDLGLVGELAHKRQLETVC